MPYLNTFNLVDEQGNAIVDGGSNRIAEEPLPVRLFRGIVQAANSTDDLLDGLAAIAADLLAFITAGVIPVPVGYALVEAYIAGLKSLLGRENEPDENVAADWQAIRAAAGMWLDPDYEGLYSQGWLYTWLEEIHDAVGSGLEWPTEAPPWYTAPDNTPFDPEAVWNWRMPATSQQAWEVMNAAWWAARTMGETLQPLRGDPRWGLVQLTTTPEGARGVAILIYPTPDWGDLDPEESLLAWLQRTDTSGLEWSQPEGYATPFAPLYDNFSVVAGAVVPLFQKRQPVTFNETPITVETTGAPVWPGADHVTFGEARVLADQLHIDETMHGVIVSVTTPPTRTGLRQIGGQLYDYGVGEIAFGTDEGDIEPWQYLGFRSAIFTPRTMAVASHVYLRVLAGASGTVTPWVIS
jgi:hypothetical protein